MRTFDYLIAHVQRCQVALEHTLETETSWLAFGERAKRPVVLKLTKQENDEWHSGEVLRAFGGAGMVRVYESEPGAVLMERLVPGHDLVQLVKEGNDDRAIHTFADVMSQIANQEPPLGCPIVFDWSLGFDRDLKFENQHIRAGLVHEARELYRKLSASASPTMLLHGDLHHYNVLLDEQRGWVAIDPKGVVGELEYEVGAILRNPGELPEIFTSRDVVERRLRILCDALQLDYRRALQWSFAQAVLSVIWDVEDRYQVQPDHPVLQLAQTLQQMLANDFGVC
jgi:streptomycin 6-kinase